MFISVSLFAHDELFYGASENQILNAPFKSMDLPTKETIKGLINEYTLNDEIIDQEVNGFYFINESKKMIEVFKHLTTPPSFAKTIVEFPASSCEKVTCAIDEIWGSDLGPKILYIFIKHKFNASEYAYIKSSRLKISEINDIILSLDDLPEHLIPIPKRRFQRLNHFERGDYLPAYGIVPAIASVILFDAWSLLTSPRRQYTVYHELGHNIGEKNKRIDLSDDWVKLGDWKLEEGETIRDEYSVWYINDHSKGCFISEYAKKHPMEDFAESVAAYRYNGINFKAKCPLKYNFMKTKIFKDIEFI